MGTCQVSSIKLPRCVVLLDIMSDLLTMTTVLKFLFSLGDAIVSLLQSIEAARYGDNDPLFDRDWVMSKRQLGGGSIPEVEPVQPPE